MPCLYIVRASPAQTFPGLLVTSSTPDLPTFLHLVARTHHASHLARTASANAGTRVEHVHGHEGFDDAAATWDDDPGHEKRQVAVAHAIEEAVELGPEMRAVDIGGGTGRLSILLAELVGSVVVTDPSAGMVRVARERIEAAGLGERLHAVQADLTTDRIEGSYDVVWSSLALHHVQDLDELLRSVAHLLVPGGRLCLADLDQDPDGAFHADKVDFDGHHGFDRQRLAEQVARAGFTDVGFVDATTILKGDREFGVFLCTATKIRQPSGDS